MNLSLRFQAAMDGHLKHLRSWMLVPGKETTSSGVYFIEVEGRPRHDGSPIAVSFYQSRSVGVFSSISS